MTSFWSGQNKPVAVAHRGADGAGTEKENSFKAFSSAYNNGVYWLETDVVTTKDNVLLAIHGRGFQLKPNKDLPPRLLIERMTYRQILNKIKIGGETVLKFETLLDNFPKAKIFVDPKTHKTALVLADFLLERSDKDLLRLCVGSFNVYKIRLIRRKLLKKRGIKLCYGRIGLQGCWPLIVFSTHASLNWLIPVYANWLGVYTFYLPYKLLMGNKGYKIVQVAHQYNVKIAAYTVNEPRAFMRLIVNNVDAVMSDRLSLLKTYK